MGAWYNSPKANGQYVHPDAVCKKRVCSDGTVYYEAGTAEFSCYGLSALGAWLEFEALFC